ncbi:hypothetical protein VMCG_04512 [Cytospora schulzeri]|uniref:3-dehydrosphinganine reductase n=1 Tax=Cytospora schulzeri TaxID=448051 RepID=A0A423WSC4_9PEZI|nr:hypothetical protein VMCG_04512 [Valsa malicola]
MTLTVLIAGGSKGTGLEAARQLAAKGGNIILIARDPQRLRDAIEYVKAGALSPETQRFHFIAADLTSNEACANVIAQSADWNNGLPPDVVWCFAGSSHPSLFIETDPAQLKAQMDSNYFSNAYMAHAALRSWLKTGQNLKDEEVLAKAGKPLARHIIFTSSFLALYPIAGYAPYSPSKAALRTLSDTLSQELNLYATANPHLPSIRVHTLFPATIYSEAYEVENRIKSDVTKMLEETDEGQTPEVVARKCIQGLESGNELVTSDFLTRFVLSTTIGASKRGGFLQALVDWILGCLGLLIMVFVRQDMDRKVRNWGKLHGDSGMRSQ